jgi:hypothetical protein
MMMMMKKKGFMCLLIVCLPSKLQQASFEIEIEIEGERGIIYLKIKE